MSTKPQARRRAEPAQSRAEPEVWPHPAAHESRPPSDAGQSRFRLVCDYKPCGDQPSAIAELTDGVRRGDRHQVLLGVTGSGKTFTMANVIVAVERPTLIIAHNKTLAAQLYNEFKQFFPAERRRVLRVLL